MKEFAPIRTDRLLIRKFVTEDCEDLFRYRSLPEVYKYQSWRPADIKDAALFIRNNSDGSPDNPDSWLQLAVCLAEGPMIGDMGIHFLKDGRQAEIGYSLSPDRQGRGYAAEAVKALTGYLFGSLEIHRITACVDPRNTRSVGLLEKLGFRKEAHFIQSYETGGEWYDECVYALLREERV